MSTLRFKIVCGTLTLFASQYLLAAPGDAFNPIDPLYRQAHTTKHPENPTPTRRYYPRAMGPNYQDHDKGLDCRQLDEKIALLENNTYSAKPSFHEDPYTGASIWIGAVWAPGTLAYLGYSGVAEYYEQDRVQNAQNRIEALRHLKARLRCYEY
jgi:hypothetical protein